MGVIKDLYSAYSKLEGKEKALRLAFKLLGLDASVLDGGPGSGNFGHKGRPGQVGGSGKGGGKAFRTQQAGKYVSVAKTKAFKSLVKKAQNSDDYRSFTHGIDPELTKLIRNQYNQSGTEERFSDYVERLRQVLKAQKPEKLRPFKMVDGKDISKDYKWEFGTSYTEPVFGQLIDTEIEDVIAKQGFNGVPKVVSQDELLEIIDAHPEMPVLFRSYAAPDADTLQDYDDMLESGEWYVDCGNGGAQYGQGMYCAGVYGDDKDYSGALDEMAHYRHVSMKNARLRWCPELGPREDCINQEGKSYVFSLDDFKKTEDGNLPMAQEVVVMLPYGFGNVKGVFMPEDPEDENSEIEFTYYTEANGYETISLDKTRYWAPISKTVDAPVPEASTRMMTLDPSAKIITYKEAEELYDGRMGQEEKKRFYTEYLENMAKELKQDGWTDDEAFLAEYAYKSGTGLHGTDDWERYNEIRNRMSDEDAKEIMEYGHQKSQDAYSRMRSVERQRREENPPKLRYNDIGSYMAALGYDAINAEGHGESQSYTIVLNRTKVILSNERLRVD